MDAPPGTYSSCLGSTPGVLRAHPATTGTQSTQKILSQDWKRELFYLTQRNKHRKSNKMLRKKNKPPVKKQENTTEKNSNEKEITNLSDKEFRGVP